MKISFIAFVISLLSVVCMAAGEPVNIQCTVSNPLNSLRENEPIVISFADIKKEIPDYVGGYVAVYGNNTEIISQQDDINGDGSWDELIFLTDLLPKEKKTFVLKINADSKPLEGVKEVQAQMFFNNPDKSITATLEASSTADNMYNRMYHHGPAWESDKIAYRLYFDKKTTVDVYGKKKYRLELADTKFYPTPSQLADGYGDDILWVGNSIGVGTLKGWNGKEATHIDPMSKRTAKIVVNGKIRTVVDMSVEGWQYHGQSLNITTRYIQYARHRDMVTQLIIHGPAAQASLDFATGVQKVRQSQTFFEKDGLMALWATEYPQPDTVKYAKETFGLGIIVPRKNVEKYTSDPINHLIVIKNNKKPVIEYTIAAASQKEEQGYKTAGEFFAYMQDLSQIVKNPVKIKLKKM